MSDQNEPSEFLIGMKGCDEETLAVVELTPPQVELLQSIQVELNSLRIYGCYPGMTVVSIEEAPSGQLDAYRHLVDEREGRNAEAGA